MSADRVLILLRSGWQFVKEWQRIVQDVNCGFVPRDGTFAVRGVLMGILKQLLPETRKVVAGRRSDQILIFHNVFNVGRPAGIRCLILRGT